MGRPSSTSPRMIEAKKKLAEALALREAGISYEVIAQRLGYANRGTVKHMIDKALDEIVAEPSERVRKLELIRLDKAHSRIWPRVMQGDILAVDRILRISERRSKLCGLDAPALLDSTVKEVPFEPVLDMARLTVQQRDEYEMLLALGTPSDPSTN